MGMDTHTVVAAEGPAPESPGMRPYLVSAGLGSSSVVVLGMPVVWYVRQGSFYWYASLLALILVGAGVAWGVAAGLSVLMRFRPGYAQGRKRYSVAVASGLGTSLLLLAALLTGTDPARQLDAHAAWAEYRAYGASSAHVRISVADAQFLTYLIDKYRPTGIDLSFFTARLAQTLQLQRPAAALQREIRKSPAVDTLPAVRRPQPARVSVKSPT